MKNLSKLFWGVIFSLCLIFATHQSVFGATQDPDQAKLWTEIHESANYREFAPRELTTLLKNHKIEKIDRVAFEKLVLKPIKPEPSFFMTCSGCSCDTGCESCYVNDETGWYETTIQCSSGECSNNGCNSNCPGNDC